MLDPAGRLTCDELLEHSYFDTFRDWFRSELDMLLAKDAKKMAKSKSRMHVSFLMQNNHRYCLSYLNIIQSLCTLDSQC